MTGLQRNSLPGGWPSPAEEKLADIMRLENWLIEKKEVLYLLTMKGDSMKGAGILEGDVVVVERGPSPAPRTNRLGRNRRHDDAKVSRQSRDGKPYLEPANSLHQPLYPKQELIIYKVINYMALFSLNQSSRAVAHIDGDAFFTSVEQAKDPRLCGRPVVTGKERGIASNMSYEAKARRDPGHAALRDPAGLPGMCHPSGLCASNLPIDGHGFRRAEVLTARRDDDGGGRVGEAGDCRGAWRRGFQAAAAAYAGVVESGFEPEPRR